MKSKKILAVIMAVIMSAGMFAGCGGKKNTETQTTPTSTPTAAEQKGFDINSAKTLKLKVLGKIQTGNRVPKEDKLTPIWREKTKIEQEVVVIPSGQTAVQYFQMQKIGGTMPDIIACTNTIFDNAENYNFLKAQNLIREIKLEDIKKYMPLTVKRLENWGVKVEDWYNANIDPKDKKLWYIPGAPNLQATSVKTEEFVRLDGDNSWNPYFWWFRDDILKQIFPQVKTEKELKELYLQKGKLDFEDVNDIPIKTLDDLYNYLKKVKELNLKVGNKPVIPGQIQCNNDIGSLMWSTFSSVGFFWQDLGDRLYDENSGKFTYFAATPEWKEFVRYFNKLYNEGLIGKETLIQKDEQRDAKVVNGEYAVFQWWLPVADARKKSNDEKRGYGFRYVPLFCPDSLKNQYQDNSYKNVSLKKNWGAIGITTNIKDEDIPQILNWIDWNYSEEANILRAWGPAEFHTGEKMNLRFKPEYKDIEAWAVSNTKSEKDGIYYGLYPAEISDADFNQETYGIGVTWYYEYSPKRAYANDLSNPANVNVDRAVENAIKLHYNSMLKFYRELPLGDDVLAARSEFDEIEKKFNTIKKTVSFDADAAKPVIAKAIQGKPEDFDKNYGEFEKKYLTQELLDNVKAMGEKWLAYKKLYNEKYRVPLE